MADTISIVPEPAKALPAAAEVGVLRSALVRNPASLVVRLRLATLLNELDEFDETIALLAAADGLEFEELLALSDAYFARDAPGDSERVNEIATRAVSLAATSRERSCALAEQAKALLRRDQPAPALDLLREALSLDRRNVSAFKRLVIELLRSGDPAMVVGLTAELLGKGINHSRLFAARTMALAALGKIDQAQDAAGLHALLYDRLLDIPAGWDSLADFNAALVHELTANPALRYERHGTASVATWRIDSPATDTTPAANALLAAIAEAVEQHVGTLAGTDHPWLAAQPERGVLRSWCVITGGEGHEQWHMHPFGWLSGGYYPQVPAAVTPGNDPAGCLAFGLPGGLIGADAAAAFGERLIRPQAGLLTLFPSHLYHRTFPHGSDDQRICIAFDILPA